MNSKDRRQKRNEIALEGLPSGSAGQPRELALGGDQETQADPRRKRKRNHKRGLRSKIKIAERNKKRSFKRRIARSQKRKQGKATDTLFGRTKSASAQEPKFETIKIQLGRELLIATLNIRGTNKLGVRKEIDY